MVPGEFPFLRPHARVGGRASAVEDGRGGDRRRAGWTVGKIRRVARRGGESREKTAAKTRAKTNRAAIEGDRARRERRDVVQCSKACARANSCHPERSEGSGSALAPRSLRRQER